MTEECRNCKFSKRNEDFSTCRRNPSFITHFHDDWCQLPHTKVGGLDREVQRKN